MTTSPLKKGQRVCLNVLCLVAAVSLIVGLLAPVMTLKKLVFVTNTFSLGSGLMSLATEGQIVLFILIGLFSVVFPVAKIGLLLFASNAVTDSRIKRWLGWLTVFGKWSMLDVFVVAVLLATVKLRMLADVEVHYGLYAFAASVLTTMIAAHLAKNWLQAAA